MFISSWFFFSFSSNLPLQNHPRILIFCEKHILTFIRIPLTVMILGYIESFEIFWGLLDELESNFIFWLFSKICWHMKSHFHCTFYFDIVHSEYIELRIHTVFDILWKIECLFDLIWSSCVTISGWYVCFRTPCIIFFHVAWWRCNQY